MPPNDRPTPPDSPRWFRIAYSRNALLRLLGRPAESLTLAEGARAMVDFQRTFRPQHAESDSLWCRWGPGDTGFEFVMERRMSRHGHPDHTLSLRFRFGPRDATGAAEVHTLRDVTASEGYRVVARARPVSVDVEER